MADAVGTRFDQDDWQGRRRLEPQPRSRCPANVEERAAGGKLPEHSEETGVAMSEPEEGMLFPATIV
jgi:hypothetical protein